MSENNQPAVVALPHQITVNIDDKPFEIFMSFALLNRICYIMGDSTQVPLILQDPELREAVLVECFAERDAKGKVLNRRTMEEISVGFEDIQNVLEFVSEHVVDFTMAAVERATRVMTSREARLKALAVPAKASS